jgi:hypothetical protein
MLSPLSPSCWSSVVVASVYKGLVHSQLTTKHVRKQSAASRRSSSELCTDPSLQSALAAHQTELASVQASIQSLVDSIQAISRECIQAASTACEYSIQGGEGLDVCCLLHARVLCVKVQFFSNESTQDNAVYTVAKAWLPVLEAIMVVANCKVWIQQLVNAGMETVTESVVQAWIDKAQEKREVMNRCIELLRELVAHTQ